MTETVNVRRFISEAVANRSFEVPDVEELPEAELDGEPFDYLAMLYAIIGAMGNGKRLRVPRKVDKGDYQRALDLIREVDAPSEKRQP